MSRANCAKILALDAGENCDFCVADAAVEVSEQSSGFRSDYSGFEVGSGESADGIEGAPSRLDKNFSLVSAVTNGNRYAEKAADPAKFAQDVFGKVLEVLGQLRFRGAGGPMAMDGARSNIRRGILFLANHNFPGAHFPLFDQAVYNVRIFASKFFDCTFVIHAKNQQGAVDGIVEGACQNEFSPFAPLPRDTQMLFAELGAARDILVHGFINQRVVVHGFHPCLITKEKRRLLGRLCHGKTSWSKEGLLLRACFSLDSVVGQRQA